MAKSEPRKCYPKLLRDPYKFPAIKIEPDDDELTLLVRECQCGSAPFGDSTTEGSGLDKVGPHQVVSTLDEYRPCGTGCTEDARITPKYGYMKTDSNNPQWLYVPQSCENGFGRCYYLFQQVDPDDAKGFVIPLNYQRLDESGGDPCQRVPCLGFVIAPGKINTQDCTWTISPASITADPEGGTYWISVICPHGCSWEAENTTGAGWFDFTPTVGLSGNRVKVTIDPDSTGAPGSIEFRSRVTTSTQPIGTVVGTVTINPANNCCDINTGTMNLVAVSIKEHDAFLNNGTAPNPPWTAGYILLRDANEEQEDCDAQLTFWTDYMTEMDSRMQNLYGGGVWIKNNDTLIGAGAPTYYVGADYPGDPGRLNFPEGDDGTCMWLKWWLDVMVEYLPNLIGVTVAGTQVNRYGKYGGNLPEAVGDTHAQYWPCIKNTIYSPCAYAPTDTHVNSPLAHTPKTNCQVDEARPDLALDATKIMKGIAGYRVAGSGPYGHMVAVKGQLRVDLTAHASGSVKLYLKQGNAILATIGMTCTYDLLGQSPTTAAEDVYSEYSDAGVPVLGGVWTSSVIQLDGIPSENPSCDSGACSEQLGWQIDDVLAVVLGEFIL